MCIIIVKPEGAKLPPFDIISRCAMRNPDGFGFAVPGRVYKAMDFVAFYAELQKSVTRDVPAIIHFRYATHGSVKRSNCHPFRDERLGLSFAHNGMLDIEPVGDKTDSETAFKHYLLPVVRHYGFESHEFVAAVRDIIGYSRFAFLTDEGKIDVFGYFNHYQGCLYSNHNYL